MSNITQIKAARLTENEVHNAIKEILEEGDKPTSLNILKVLGRGSLTTITKFINTFNQDNKTEEANTLPALTELPVELTKFSEQLIIKVWSESQTIANRDIEIQREALHQAELKAEARIKEAELFSEEQAKKIEILENNYDTDIKNLKERIESTTKVLIERNALNQELNTKNAVLKSEKEGLENNLKEIGISSEKAYNMQEDQIRELKEKIRRLETEHGQDIEDIEDINNKEIEESTTAIKREQNKTAELGKENYRLELQVDKQQLRMDILIEKCEKEEIKARAATSDKEHARELLSKLEGELKAWKELRPKKHS